MYVLKVNFEHSVMTSFGETMNTISIAVVVHCIIHLMVIIKVDFFFFLMFLKRVKKQCCLLKRWTSVQHLWFCSSLRPLK